MAKFLQAFFKTEDDAESVKTDLVKLKTSDIRIDHLPDASQTLLLTPLAYNSSTSSSVGGNGFVASITNDNGQEVNDDSPREYTIEFNVEEEDFEEALHVIMKSDGYVDKKTVDL
ncbi:hypothetical protein SAMN04487944_102179 [Gracilibacillus ureilyticus]|uniref:Heat induced stress protein YflT n=1 Tax=Gracilibacillus ureilyticus TaxID=531814 RepID=A0A1H9MVY1_9BACI|nr:hypothetical protein [Gracilibacillus ureilyticus]SER27575.1 hypothetical protein SAMN04487944_102179 [Gracilibacillus ureilyticus]